MKKLNWVWGLAWVVLMAGSARAGLEEDLFLKSCMNSAKIDCKRAYVEGGGGGGLPRGLGTNSTAELAIDEQYLLSGTVEIFANQPFLEIDFETHPWLASARRKANPYYRIKDDLAPWKKLKGKRVLVLVTVREAIWAVGMNRYTHEILLVPVEAPVVNSSYRPSRDR